MALSTDAVGKTYPPVVYAVGREKVREFALAVGEGRTNAEIAARLFLSVATVKAHITRILTKLGLGNRTQIALLMHDAGLC